MTEAQEEASRFKEADQQLKEVIEDPMCFMMSQWNGMKIDAQRMREELVEEQERSQLALHELRVEMQRDLDQTRADAEEAESQAAINLEMAKVRYEKEIQEVKEAAKRREEELWGDQELQRTSAEMA